MPTADAKNRTITKVNELMLAEFHGHSHYWKGDRKFPSDWNYYPTPVAQDVIIADLGDGYETRTWNQLGDDDRRDVLKSYLKRDGFTVQEFERLIENVISDEIGNPQAWFREIPEKNDFDRFLDDLADRAKFRPQQKDRGIER